MSPNANRSNGKTWEDSTQAGQTQLHASKSGLHSRHQSTSDEPQAWEETIPDGESTSQPLALKHRTRHRARSSQKLSNELHLRSHVTRDSLVSNLLSSFNQIPDGQGPYPEQPDLESSFPSLDYPQDQDRDPQLPADLETRHFRDFSSSTAKPVILASGDPFDPYSNRTTPIRSSGALHKSSQSIDRKAQPQMESPSKSRIDATSRPSTALSSKTTDKRKKNRSKGSKKSVDHGDASTDVAQPDGQIQVRSSASIDLSSKNHTRRRSRTNPGSSSILNRARPVPVEYHDFESMLRTRDLPASQNGSFSARPPLPIRQSSAMSVQNNSRPQTSSRGQFADLLGTSVAHVNSSGTIPSTHNSSRQPSMQMLANDPSSSSARSPSTSKTAPPMDLRKEKQGFFRRVFGASNKTQAPAQPEPTPYLLPPIQTGQTLEPKRSRSALSNGSEVFDRPIASERSQDQSNSIPAAPEVPTEQPHVIQKKTSFFRRRKRTASVSHEGQDLKIDSEAADTSTRLPSPSVSSLREIMNPFLSEGSNTVVSPVETTYYDSRENQSLDGDEIRHDPVGPLHAPKASRGAASGLMKSSTSSRHVADSTSGSKRSERVDGLRSDANRVVRENKSFLSDSSGVLTPAQGSVTQLDGSPQTEGDQDLSTPRQRNLEFSDPANSSTRSVATDNAEVPAPPLASDVVPSTVRLIQSYEMDDEWVVTARQKPAGDVDSPRTRRIWLHPSVSDGAPNDSAPTSRMASVSSAPSQEFGSSSSPPISPHDGESVSRSTSVTADSTTDVSGPSSEDMARAKLLFDGDGDGSTSNETKTALLLGQSGAGSERLRQAYMSLYDFAGLNILLALRDLCGRLALKGETQQVDRILTAFSQRWIDCNPNHGLKNQDVVHTMCYSLLLLNTDLHIADMDSKMTRSQFVRNTLETIRQAANDHHLVPSSATLRADHAGKRGSIIPWRETRSPSPASIRRPSADIRSPDGRLSMRPPPRPTSEVPSFNSPGPYDTRSTESADLLINAPFEGTARGWEVQVETILKEFYLSIRHQRLPLFGASEVQLHEHSSNTSLGVGGAVGRRPSTLSKVTSEGARRGSDFHSWNIRSRSKQRLYPSSAHGSSRTSFEDGSVFSPNASSTWSRSYGKGPTSMSSDSIASHFTHSDYGFQQSIGFASALSHAIIREEDGLTNAEEDGGTEALLDDESLGLEGAPWGKEGMVQHKHHMETTDKKAKDRNWNQSFAVVENGCMRLFSFNSKASIRSQKNRSLKGGAIVGGGNWMDSAEAVGTFTLRQTLANTLPAPGYSKSRPNVFALVLPTGAVHLFHVGTPEIAKEFVSTANYWSARLSKEPLIGSVSNIEYGWSENVINMALVAPQHENTRPESAHPPSSAAAARKLHSPTPSTSTISARPSFQGSLRGGSIDLPGRARLPGDRVALSEWVPPQQSLSKSTLKEKDQLEALKRYVKDVEDELKQHNELRAALLLTYSPRHPNSTKAMSNWERKSSYLLREIVKFRTYIDTLVTAQADRERVYRERAERLAPTTSAEDVSLHASQPTASTAA